MCDNSSRWIRFIMFIKFIRTTTVVYVPLGIMSIDMHDLGSMRRSGPADDTNCDVMFPIRVYRHDRYLQWRPTKVATGHLKEAQITTSSTQERSETIGERKSDLWGYCEWGPSELSEEVHIKIMSPDTPGVQIPKATFLRK